MELEESLSHMLSAEIPPNIEKEAKEAIKILDRVIERNRDNDKIVKLAASVRYLIIKTVSPYLRQKIAKEILSMDTSNETALISTLGRLLRGNIFTFQDYINRSIDALSGDKESKFLLSRIATAYSLLVSLVFEGPSARELEKKRESLLKKTEEILRAAGMVMGDDTERRKVIKENFSSLLTEFSRWIVGEAIRGQLWISDSMKLDFNVAMQFKESMDIDAIMLLSPSAKKQAIQLRKKKEELVSIIEQFHVKLLNSFTGEFLVRGKNILKELQEGVSKLFGLLELNPGEEEIEFAEKLKERLEYLLKKFVSESGKSEVIFSLLHYLSRKFNSINRVSPQTIKTLNSILADVIYIAGEKNK